MKLRYKIAAAVLAPFAVLPSWPLGMALAHATPMHVSSEYVSGYGALTLYPDKTASFTVTDSVPDIVVVTPLHSNEYRVTSYPRDKNIRHSLTVVTR